MDKQILLNEPDKIILEVLKLLRQSKKAEVDTSMIQTKLTLGYSRACGLIDVLRSAGIISAGDKYVMAMGKDGKKHRMYFTPKVIVSALELDECIGALEAMKYDRIKGSIFGGAAGDALGNTVEFMYLSQIKQKYGEKGITEPDLENGKALITDDTQMLLFTAEGIFLWAVDRDKNTALESFIYMAYLDWLHTQFGSEEYVPTTELYHVSDLHFTRAPGNTCISALRSGKMGTLERPINNSKGCGGVMRIAPVGLYFNSAMQYIDDTVMMGAKTAAITHGHPLGYISAAAMTYIVNEIVYGRTKELKEICEDAVKIVKKLFPRSETEEFAELMHEVFELADSELSDKDAIKRLGEGWCGDSALAIAVYCCQKHDSFEDVVCAAVNIDGDSDSVGAIAGNIMGAWIGYDAIPEKYTKDLELQDVLEKTAKRICFKDNT